MNVIIGTPTYDGKLDVHYNESLINTYSQGIKLGINIFPFYIAYDALVQRARNDIFQIAYTNNIDQLVYIDADIGWKADDFFQLIFHKQHIVGGTYRKKSDFQEDYVLKIEEKNLKINENNLMEVNGVGMGFTKIDNYAIQKIWNNSDKYIENNTEKVVAFNVSFEDNKIISEDINFCNKWLNLNEKIYLDPYITCNHTGIKTYYGNFFEFFQKRIGDNNGNKT